jgi:hypothetical protein
VTEPEKSGEINETEDESRYKKRLRNICLNKVLFVKIKNGCMFGLLLLNLKNKEIKVCF